MFKSKLFTLFICICLSFTVNAGDYYSLLKTLSEVHGISGFEGPIRDEITKTLREQKIKYHIDGVGNVLVGNIKDKTLPTVLLMAHMDEIGFITTGINSAGHILAKPLGGWLDTVVWSQSWQLYTGNASVKLVSGIDPPHVLTDFTKSVSVGKDKLFFDSGLSKIHLDKIGVRPGLPIAPVTKFSRLNDTDLVTGKAFDDRAGIAVLMQLLQNRKLNSSKINVVYAFTVQEELGMRGAKTVAKQLSPDLVINLDSGLAGDYPRQLTNEKGIKLGAGPSLFVLDSSMVPNPNLVALVESYAKKSKTPYQFEAETGYGEDGSSVQTAEKGSPTINLGIPTRYVHSHVNILDLNDLTATENLLIAILNNITDKEISSLTNEIGKL